MARADHFFGATDMGRQRSNNEDAFIAKEIDNNKILACVIDGVGGYEGGEVAAAIAKETILENFSKPAADIILNMKSCFVQANQKIYEDRLKHPDRNNMACVVTLTVADMQNNQFYYAHVGDTRLYLFRDHSLVKVTKDHSFVGFLEDNKRLSEAEAMNHPKRNEVNKALGYDPNMAGVTDYIETGSSPFLPGDLLMLCSDGLTDLVDTSSLTAILDSSDSLSEKAQILINAANDAGGKDNITVVLAFNNKKITKQKATKPVTLKKNEKAPPKNEIKKEVHQERSNKKRGSSLVLFLLMLVLLLAAAVYFLWKQTAEKDSNKNVIQTTKAILRNPNEQRFMDSLEIYPFIFIDSSYGRQLTITDTVFVNKDSLYINGNGIVINSDSSFKGPFLVTSPNCNYVLLENMVIDNFLTGLVTHSRIVRLKNVQFTNCDIPVQYNASLPLNRPLNGSITDSIFFKKDTIITR